MPPTMKANPRRQELADARQRAMTAASNIPAILQPAAEAMTAKAWVGGTSGDFAAGLSEHVPAARRGGSASVDEIQAAYDRCPAEIPDPATEAAH